MLPLPLPPPLLPLPLPAAAAAAAATWCARIGHQGFGGTVGTPREGITAAVLVVGGWAELAERRAEVPGKIVVISMEWEGCALRSMQPQPVHL